jgi:4-amino-4-deoxy-L-arabinose transferase-like glycosyltransferase
LSILHDKSLQPSRSEGPPVPRRRLAIACVAIAALYLAGVVNAWWPTPDSALYQGLGRNLFAGRGYVFNGHGHTTVAPGLPVLLGLTELLAGPEAFWAKNLLMCLCGLAGLGFAYASLRRIVQQRLALAAVAATALSAVYYQHSHLVLTDAPFALLFWAVVYSSLRMQAGSWKWLDVVVILCAAAILIRLPGLTVLGPLAVAMVLDRSLAAGPAGLTIIKRLGLAGAIVASMSAAAVGFYVVAWNEYHQPSLYVTVHLAEGHGVLFRLWQLVPLVAKLPETAGELFTGRQGTIVSVLGAGLLALVAVGLLRQWRRGLRMPAAVIVMTALAMVLTGGIIAAKARYYVPLMPLIAMGLIEGVIAAVEWLRRRQKLAFTPPTRNVAMLLAIGGIAIANGPFLIRSAQYDSYRAYQGKYLESIAGGIYEDLPLTASVLQWRVKPGQTVLARPDRVNELSFLSGKVIDSLHSSGLNDPWNAEQAEITYRDLLSRKSADWVIDDPGGLDRRYTVRLAYLLDTTAGLELYDRIGRTRIYRRTGELARATTPATAVAPATSSAPAASTKPGAP